MPWPPAEVCGPDVTPVLSPAAYANYFFYNRDPSFRNLATSLAQEDGVVAYGQRAHGHASMHVANLDHSSSGSTYVNDFEKDDYVSVGTHGKHAVFCGGKLARVLQIDHEEKQWSTVGEVRSGDVAAAVDAGPDPAFPPPYAVEFRGCDVGADGSLALGATIAPSGGALAASMLVVLEPRLITRVVTSNDTVSFNADGDRCEDADAPLGAACVANSTVSERRIVTSISNSTNSAYVTAFAAIREDLGFATAVALRNGTLVAPSGTRQLIVARRAVGGWAISDALQEPATVHGASPSGFGSSLALRHAQLVAGAPGEPGVSPGAMYSWRRHRAAVAGALVPRAPGDVDVPAHCANASMAELRNGSSPNAVAACVAARLAIAPLWPWAEQKSHVLVGADAAPPPARAVWLYGNDSALWRDPRLGGAEPVFSAFCGSAGPVPGANFGFAVEATAQHAPGEGVPPPDHALIVVGAPRDLADGVRAGRAYVLRADVGVDSIAGSPGIGRWGGEAAGGSVVPGCPVEEALNPFWQRKADRSAYAVSISNERVYFGAPFAGNEFITYAQTGRMYVAAYCAPNRRAEGQSSSNDYVRTCRACPAGTRSGGGTSGDCQSCGADAKPEHSAFAGPGRGCAFVCDLGHYGEDCVTCALYAEDRGLTKPANSSWAIPSMALPHCVWVCDPGFVRDGDACRPPQPPGPVTDLATTRVGASSVALRWPAPAGLGETANRGDGVISRVPAAGHEVQAAAGDDALRDALDAEAAGPAQYAALAERLLASTVTLPAGPAEEDGSNGYYFAFAVGGLAPDTAHRFRARSATAGGWGPWSNFTALPPVRTTQPTAPAAPLAPTVACAADDPCSCTAWFRAAAETGGAPLAVASAAFAPSPALPSGAEADFYAVLWGNAAAHNVSMTAADAVAAAAAGAASQPALPPPPHLVGASGPVLAVLLRDVPAQTALAVRSGVQSGLGTSPPSPSSAVTTPPAVPPTAPAAAPVATPSFDTLRVAVAQPVCWGGAAARGVEVQAVPDGTTFSTACGGDNPVPPCAALHVHGSPLSPPLSNYALQALPAGTKWRLRARISNEAGWGNWSAVGTATTHAAVPASAPTAVAIVDTAADAVHLTWRSSSVLGGSGLTAHRVVLAPADGSTSAPTREVVLSVAESLTQSAAPAPLSAAAEEADWPWPPPQTQFSAWVRGLRASTQYVATVIPLTGAVGVGDASLPSSPVATDAAVPPDAPPEVRAVWSGSDSIGVRVAVPEGRGGLDVTSVEAQASVDGTTFGPLFAAPVTGNADTEVPVGELAASTTYVVRGRVRTAAGAGPWLFAADPVSTDPATAPGAAPSLILHHRTRGEAEVEVMAAAASGGAPLVECEVVLDANPAAFPRAAPGTPLLPGAAGGTTASAPWRAGDAPLPTRIEPHSTATAAPHATPVVEAGSGRLPPASVRLSLGPLSAAAAYNATARCRNDLGWGPAHRFAPPLAPAEAGPSPPAAPVLHDLIAEPGSVSVQLVTPTGLGGEPVEAYAIEVAPWPDATASAPPEEGWAPSARAVLLSASARALVLRLDGLLGATGYGVRAASVSVGGGAGPWSLPLRVETARAEEEPPLLTAPAPVDAAAIPAEWSSARVAWSVAETRGRLPPSGFVLRAVLSTPGAPLRTLAVVSAADACTPPPPQPPAAADPDGWSADTLPPLLSCAANVSGMCPGEPYRIRVSPPGDALASAESSLFPAPLHPPPPPVARSLRAEVAGDGVNVTLDAGPVAAAVASHSPVALEVAVREGGTGVVLARGRRACRVPRICGLHVPMQAECVPGATTDAMTAAAACLRALHVAVPWRYGQALSVSATLATVDAVSEPVSVQLQAPSSAAGGAAVPPPSPDRVYGGVESPLPDLALRVAWRAPRGRTGSPIAAYRVLLRTAGSAGEGEVAATLDAAAALGAAADGVYVSPADAAVAMATPWEVGVVAVDASGAASAPAWAAATLRPTQTMPAAPMALRTETVAPGCAQVRWDAAAGATSSVDHVLDAAPSGGNATAAPGDPGVAAAVAEGSNVGNVSTWLGAGSVTVVARACSGGGGGCSPGAALTVTTPAPSAPAPLPLAPVVTAQTSSVASVAWKAAWNALVDGGPCGAAGALGGSPLAGASVRLRFASDADDGSGPGTFGAWQAFRWAGSSAARRVRRSALSAGAWVQAQVMVHTGSHSSAPSPASAPVRLPDPGPLAPLPAPDAPSVVSRAASWLRARWRLGCDMPLEVPVKDVVGVLYLAAATGSAAVEWGPSDPSSLGDISLAPTAPGGTALTWLRGLPATTERDDTGAARFTAFAGSLRAESAYYACAALRPAEDASEPAPLAGPCSHVIGPLVTDAAVPPTASSPVVVAVNASSVTVRVPVHRDGGAEVTRLRLLLEPPLRTDSGSGGSGGDDGVLMLGADVPWPAPGRAAEARYTIRHVRADTEMTVRAVLGSEAGLGRPSPPSETVRTKPAVAAGRAAWALVQNATSDALRLSAGAPLDLGGAPLTGWSVRVTSDQHGVDRLLLFSARDTCSWGDRPGMAPDPSQQQSQEEEEAEGPVLAPCPRHDMALTGLWAASAYEVEVVPVTSVGDGGARHMGPDPATTTLPASAPLPPSAVTVLSPTQYSVRVRVEPPLALGGDEAWPRLVVAASEEGGDGASFVEPALYRWVGDAVWHPGNASAVEAEVLRLRAGSSVVVKAGAVSAAGQSPLSALSTEARVRTPATVPHPPRKVGVTSIAPRRVALAWHAPLVLGGSPLAAYHLRRERIGRMSTVCNASLGAVALDGAWAPVEGAEAPSAAVAASALGLQAADIHPIPDGDGGAAMEQTVSLFGPVGAENASAADDTARAGEVAAYSVAASTEDGGRGAASVHAVVLTPVAAPAAPTSPQLDDVWAGGQMPTAVACADGRNDSLATGRATLHWDEPADAGGCALLQHEVAVRAVGCSGWGPGVTRPCSGAVGFSWTLLAAGPDATSVPLSSLPRACTVSARARVKSALGWSPWSVTVNATTPRTAPSPPRGLHVHGVGWVSSALNVTAPADSSGWARLHYQMQVVMLPRGAAWNGGEPAWGEVEEVPPSVASVTRPGEVVVLHTPQGALAPGRNHSVRVRAVPAADAELPSPWSAPARVVTRPPLPCPKNCSSRGECHAYRGTCRCNRGFAAPACAAVSGSAAFLSLRGSVDTVDPAVLEVELAKALGVSASRVVVLRIEAGSVRVLITVLEANEVEGGGGDSGGGGGGDGSGGDTPSPEPGANVTAADALKTLDAMARGEGGSAGALQALGVEGVATGGVNATATLEGAGDAAAAGAQLVPVAAPTCGQHTWCGTCTRDPACGWCGGAAPGEAQCVAGTAAGVANGEAACPSSWHKDPDACSAECGWQPECGQCLETAGCEWCPYWDVPSQSACAQGGHTSASHCSIDVPYVTTPDACPAPEAVSAAAQCALHQGKASCVADSGCGWCEESPPRCVSGDPFGSDLCPVNSYQWTASRTQCPTHDRCSSCAKSGACGWCPSAREGGACGDPGKGTSSCPVDGWVFDGEKCPPEPAKCSAQKYCRTCNAESHCRWCDSSSQCVERGSEQESQCVEPGDKCWTSCVGTQWRTDLSGDIRLGADDPFPVHYRPNMQCEWIVTPIRFSGGSGDGSEGDDDGGGDSTARVSRIRLDVMRLDLRSGDAVSVHTGSPGKQENLIVRLTGSTSAKTVDPLRSETGTMLVRFTSNAVGAGTGFHVRFEAESGESVSVLMMTSLVLGGILVATCLCCLCLRIYTGRRDTSDVDPWWESDNGMGVMGPASRSRADASIVAQLRTLPMTGARLARRQRLDRDTSCVICLVDYEDGDKLLQLPCQHSFHTECITGWFELNRTCPLCKRDVHEMLCSSRRDGGMGPSWDSGDEEEVEEDGAETGGQVPQPRPASRIPGRAAVAQSRWNAFGIARATPQPGYNPLRAPHHNPMAPRHAATVVHPPTVPAEPELAASEQEEAEEEVTSRPAAPSGHDAGLGLSDVERRAL